MSGGTGGNPLMFLARLLLGWSLSSVQQGTRTHLFITAQHGFAVLQRRYVSRQTPHSLHPCVAARAFEFFSAAPLPVWLVLGPTPTPTLFGPRRVAVDASPGTHASWSTTPTVFLLCAAHGAPVDTAATASAGCAAAAALERKRTGCTHSQFAYYAKCLAPYFVKCLCCVPSPAGAGGWQELHHRRWYPQAIREENNIARHGWYGQFHRDGLHLESRHHPCGDAVSRVR